jgi:hypothetical protein
MPWHKTQDIINKKIKINIMKKNLLTAFIALFTISIIAFVGCKKVDTEAPQVSTSGILTDDLIQVTNDNAFVPVEVSSTDNKSIDSIRISIIKKGTTDIAAFASVRNINASSAKQIVKVPFPYPFDAPSGKYTIVVISIDLKGNDNRVSFDVNILNNRFIPTTACAFTNMPIPAGKNVMVRVVVPASTGNDDVYVSGNFEAFNGGGGDWTGGNAPFKMTRLSPTCFYIFLNLQQNMELKFTRGDWSKEDRDEFGNPPKNFKWVSTIPGDNNFYYVTGAYIDCFAKNWKDRVVLPQLILPSQAVASGKMTFTLNVDDVDDSKKYFLVKKGGNLLDQSNPMYRVKTTSGSNTNRVAGSIPKDGSSWLIVRGLAGEVGINGYGYEQEISWDGKNNPNIMFVKRWKSQGVDVTPSNNLFVIGSATPGGWNNPVPTPSQQFTALGNGKFVINSIVLKGNDKMLFLPNNGDWTNWCTGFDYLNGNTFGTIQINGPGGADIFTPAGPDATYKIEVDLYRGVFKLTKL